MHVSALLLLLVCLCLLMSGSGRARIVSPRRFVSPRGLMDPLPMSFSRYVEDVPSWGLKVACRLGCEVMHLGWPAFVSWPVQIRRVRTRTNRAEGRRVRCVVDDTMCIYYV